MNCLTQKPRYLSIYLFIFCIPILIYNGDFFTSVSQPISQSVSVLDFMIDNLNTAPIQSLLFTNQTCPSGYEQASLGVWVGLDKGKTEIKGKDVKVSLDLSSQIIKKWEDKNICIKRNVRIETIDSRFCRVGFKPCSKNLCVSQHEDCPITRIKKLGTGENQSTYSEVVTLTENKTFAIFRNFSEQPIVNLSYSINVPSCLAKGRVPTESNQYLQSVYEIGCGMYGIDYENTPIDTIREIDLYDDNSILQTILASTSGYINLLQGDQVLLQYRQRINLDMTRPECQSNIYGDYLTDQANEISDWGLKIVGLIVTEVIIAIITSLKFLCDKPKNSEYFFLALCIVTGVNFLLNSMYYIGFINGLQYILSADISHVALGLQDCYSTTLLNHVSDDFLEYQKKLRSIMTDCDVGFLLMSTRILMIFFITFLEVGWQRVKKYLQKRKRPILERSTSIGVEDSQIIPIRRNLSTLHRARLRTERTLSRNGSQINLEELPDSEN